MKDALDEPGVGHDSWSGGTREGEEPKVPATLEGARLLVIDDDPARLDALAQSLRRLGFEVGVGDRGESGYRQALRFRPDVVLSDIVSPGERGWWLVQHLRRHPLLRFTPVLLFRFWEESDGELVVHTRRVIERLTDLVSPTRLLDERIAAGRPLADRVETLGVPTLLRVLGRARLTGRLTVNDSWSVFEADLRAGKLIAVSRRGVDGSFDTGDETLLEMALSETGRWSFRGLPAIATPGNLSADDQELFTRLSRVIAQFFGPEANPPARGAPPWVRLEVLAAVSPSLPFECRQLAGAVARGARPAELDALLAGADGLALAERTLLALVRSGAVVLLAQPSGAAPTAADQAAVQAVLHLVIRAAADHTKPVSGALATSTLASTQPPQGPAPALSPVGTSPAKPQGFYLLSAVAAERVAGTKRDELHVPGASTPPAVAVPSSSRAARRSRPRLGATEEPARPPAEDGPEQPAARSTPREVAVPTGQPSIRPYESFAPLPPASDERVRKQMWLAVALAVVLGLGMVAVLVVVGTSRGQERASPMERP